MNTPDPSLQSFSPFRTRVRLQKQQANEQQLPKSELGTHTWSGRIVTFFTITAPEWVKDASKAFSRKMADLELIINSLFESTTKSSNAINVDSVFDALQINQALQDPTKNPIPHYKNKDELLKAITAMEQGIGQLEHLELGINQQAKTLIAYADVIMTLISSNKEYIEQSDQTIALEYLTSSKGIQITPTNKTKIIITALNTIKKMKKTDMQQIDRSLQSPENTASKKEKLNEEYKNLLDKALSSDPEFILHITFPKFEPKSQFLLAINYIKEKLNEETSPAESLKYYNIIFSIEYFNKDYFTTKISNLIKKTGTQLLHDNYYDSLKNIVEIINFLNIEFKNEHIEDFEKTNQIPHYKNKDECQKAIQYIQEKVNEIPQESTFSPVNDEIKSKIYKYKDALNSLIENNREYINLENIKYKLNNLNDKGNKDDFLMQRRFMLDICTQLEKKTQTVS